MSRDGPCYAYCALALTPYLVVLRPRRTFRPIISRRCETRTPLREMTLTRSQVWRRHARLLEARSGLDHLIYKSPAISDTATPVARAGRLQIQTILLDRLPAMWCDPVSRLGLSNACACTADAAHLPGTRSARTQPGLVTICLAGRVHAMSRAATSAGVCVHACVRACLSADRDNVPICRAGRRARLLASRRWATADSSSPFTSLAKANDLRTLIPTAPNPAVHYL